jgi:hypothetical protein
MNVEASEVPEYRSAFFSKRKRFFGSIWHQDTRRGNWILLRGKGRLITEPVSLTRSCEIYRQLQLPCLSVPSIIYKRIVRITVCVSRENTKGTQGQNRKRLVKAVIPSMSPPFSEVPYYHVIRIQVSATTWR